MGTGARSEWRASSPMMPTSRGRRDLKIKSFYWGPRLRVMENEGSPFGKALLFFLSLCLEEKEMCQIFPWTQNMWLHVLAARRGQHTQPADFLILCQHYICLSLRAFKTLKWKKKWNSVFCIIYVNVCMDSTFKSLALPLCHGHTPLTLPPEIIIMYVLRDHYILCIWSCVE